MEDENKQKNIIYYKGPNLVLFSVALLLSIFAAYSVGVLVTKKAQQKLESSANDSNSNIKSNAEHEYSKAVISGKSYVNSDNNKIIYFYNDNTYYLKSNSYNEYGTYDVNDNKITIYNLFSMSSKVNEITTLSGQVNIILDKDTLHFSMKDSDGKEYEEIYVFESSNINGSMSNIISKIQKEFENKDYCK